MSETTNETRPVVLVTGVGRTVGIGAAIALRLAEDGWDVATTQWTAYDDRMPWGRHDEAPRRRRGGADRSGAPARWRCRPT